MQETDIDEFDYDYLKKNNEPENLFFQEYHFLADNLKKEIDDCKTEQSRLRHEIEKVQNESKITNESVRDYFSQVQDEKCPFQSEKESMIIVNLEKRLALMQMEKDSVFQLWQTSLKAIDVLEEELRTCQQGQMDTELYENQLKTIKESYSTAIKELESKLVESKEHFFMQQNLFESNNSKMNQLCEEKNGLEEKLKSQKKALDEFAESLKSREFELEVLKKEKVEAEEKLREVQKRLANLTAKENESLSKVSEALELVESAIREKENALQRESRALDEAALLRNRMNNIDEEYAVKLKNEMARSKELYDENLKKYAGEIEELKIEIQQKVTSMDRMQREYRLAQEELNTMRQHTNKLCQTSETKLSEMEKKLRGAELRLQTCEETWKLKYNEKCYMLEQYEKLLNEKLHEPTEKLRNLHTNNLGGMENLVKEVNERTKEAVQKYENIERNLSRSLYDRDKVDRELHSLQNAFEREAERRDKETKLMELKIRELQENLRIMTTEANNAKVLHRETNIFPTVGTDAQIKQLQELNDSKIKELTLHVENYQKLCYKWKEEIKTLSSNFKKHSKDMKNKVHALRQENEELNKELYMCRQKLARYSLHIASW